MDILLRMFFKGIILLRQLYPSIEWKSARILSIYAPIIVVNTMLVTAVGKIAISISIIRDAANLP